MSISTQLLFSTALASRLIIIDAFFMAPARPSCLGVYACTSSTFTSSGFLQEAMTIRVPIINVKISNEFFIFYFLFLILFIIVIPQLFFPVSFCLKKCQLYRHLLLPAQYLYQAGIPRLLLAHMIDYIKYFVYILIIH